MFVFTLTHIQYETVTKLLSSDVSPALSSAFAATERVLRREGVCLTVHFLQILVGVREVCEVE